MNQSLRAILEDRDYPANGAPYPRRALLRREVIRARRLRQTPLLQVFAFLAGVVALTYAAGCTVDGPALVVTPVGPVGWSAQVQEAADLWNDATACDVIDLGDGLEVILYGEGEWPDADNVRGFWDGEVIGIRTVNPEVERATLVHEMGHAFGAPHSDDPNSVMWPIVGGRYIPTPADAALVAQLIGC